MNEQEEKFWQEAFCRNIGLVTRQEQNILRNTRVAIAGLGGVGGLHLTTLARLGIGKFSIADPDCFETVNIQRQCGACNATLGKSKAQVMRDMAFSINPHLDIRMFDCAIDTHNVSEFLEGCDIFVDGVDFFCLRQRRVLFDAAYKKGIYAITAGPLGFGSALLVFAPRAMTFDQYFDIREDMTDMEKIIAFAAGLAPAALHMQYLQLGSVSLQAKQGPSLAGACMICAGLAATEVMRVAMKRPGIKPAPHYMQFDSYRQKCSAGYLIGANRNPVQMLKRWYLKKRFGGQ